MNKPAYEELQSRNTRLHRLDHLQAICSWDRAANMPAKGNESRSLALAEMEGLLHELASDPAWPPLLARVEQEALNEDERANLRETRRAWNAANALPPALVEAKSLAG